MKAKNEKLKSKESMEKIVVRETISAAEAGRRLGRGAHTIEYGLRTGQLPFGTAFKTAVGRYIYIIPKNAFEKYLRGELHFYGKPVSSDAEE